MPGRLARTSHAHFRASLLWNRIRYETDNDGRAGHSLTHILPSTLTSKMKKAASLSANGFAFKVTELLGDLDQRLDLAASCLPAQS